MLSKPRLFIGLTVVLIIISLVLLFASNKKSAPQISEPTEISQTEAASTVIIDNTDGLHALLLNEQYSTVYQALSSYLRDHVAKNIDHAVIVGNPSVANNGLISFRVKIDKPQKEFGVTIDRKVFDKIVFRVVDSNYTQTIQVYGQDTGD